MRPAGELKSIVDSSLAITSGVMPLVIVAQDDAESTALWALLKGRRGGKSITIRIARDPDEFVPLIDLARRPKTPAAPDDEELDYGGY